MEVVLGMKKSYPVTSSRALTIVEEVDNVPQGAQGDHVPIIVQGNDVPVVLPELTNSDIREDLLALARTVTTQANLSMVPRMNVVESNMSSRLSDFVRINPLIFLGYKVRNRGFRSSEGRISYDMLNNDMTLSRLIVYAQPIEESKLKTTSRNMKRSGSSDQDQTRFKKRAQGQEEPRSAKVKLEKRGGSQNGKLMCVTCGKRHYGKCLDGNSGFYGCGKDDHKVMDRPTIAARGREGKQVARNLPKDDSPNKRRFCAVLTIGANPNEDDGDGKTLYLFSVMISFLVRKYVEKRSVDELSYHFYLTHV
ncbi:hypothetical protein EJD97_003882 [Solanum chilense]|uniref:Gag-pol polyprotein n=1 Tax=Solanum chilense TaxID=4083 RepID=A0A6N2CJK6_SOLCI|nr:hypothetical protein EJD97_003882 [Solanum chilense]